MTTQQKAIFWAILTVSVFVLFRWLAGVAMPQIATPFALGLTALLISGLFLGHFITALAIRTGALQNITRTLVLTSAFVVAGFIAIAFLANAMIGDTQLFPFAITVLLLFMVTAAAGSFATMVRHQYKSKIQSAQLAAAHSKSELQLLQSQLSPHFLFNTLNNIYGLSLTAPERVPALLLKLSELLRYSVYDVKEVLVTLTQETDYLRNYIEFEKLRLGERLDLKVEMDPTYTPDCKIPPLMLVVLVENAFKHSRTAGDDAIHIRISLRKRQDQIVFSIANSWAENRVETTEGPLQKHSGFGLESVRRRLKLLYPGQHTLEIKKSNNEFTVHLEFPCQQR